MVFTYHWKVVEIATISLTQAVYEFTIPFQNTLTDVKIYIASTTN